MQRVGNRWKPWALVLALLALDIVVTWQIAGAGLRPFSWRTLGGLSVYLYDAGIFYDAAPTGEDGIQVCAQGLEPGTAYVLQRSPNLLDTNAWTFVGPPQVAVSNTSEQATNSLCFTDTNAVPAPLFYRLLAVQ